MFEQTTNSIRFTPRYSSIAEWAAALGSNAATRAGQRKAIMASFEVHDGLRAISRAMPRANGYISGVGFSRNAENKARYIAMQKRNREERRAAILFEGSIRPSDLGMVGCQVAVETLQETRVGYAVVGEWYVSCHEEKSYDRDYYSKAWHRRYGPKVTVERRTIQIRRPLDNWTRVESRDVDVDGWRGNWLLNALVQAGVLDEHKGKMPIRLHPAYDVRLARTLGDIRLYERTLAGEHVDWCVEWHGLTYHAASPRACTDGIRAKLTQAERAKTATITAALGRSLGFCEAGMRQFATDFGLDFKGAYTPDEIAARVKGDIGTASKYALELRKLAAAVDYPIPAEIAS